MVEDKELDKFYRVDENMEVVGRRIVEEAFPRISHPEEGYQIGREVVLKRSDDFHPQEVVYEVWRIVGLIGERYELGFFKDDDKDSSLRIIVQKEDIRPWPAFEPLLNPRHPDVRGDAGDKRRRPNPESQREETEEDDLLNPLSPLGGDFGLSGGSSNPFGGFGGGSSGGGGATGDY